MTTREALAEIHARGFESLTIWRLRGMISRGELPTPRMNSALRWDWTDADIDRIMTTLQEREAEASK